MKKVLDLLEEHIQWLAVAIGALFLGWAAWSYLLAPSWATVERGGQVFSGGELDRATVDGPVAVLEQKMTAPGTVQIPVPDLAGQFAGQFSGAPFAALPDRWAIVPARPPEGLITNQPVAVVPEGPGLSPLPANIRIAALPASLPAATPIAISSGISNVIDPNNPNANPNDPNDPGIEKEWATLSFRISVTDLAARFAQSNIPATAQTMFLTVETERQERNSDGTWGAAAILPPLKVTQIALERPDYPGNQPPNQLPQFREIYRQWALRATQEILQPGFFNVVGGVPWEVPGADQIAGAAAGTGEFRPEDFIGLPPAQWPNDEAQKAAIRRLIQERAREDARNRRPPPGAGRGGRGGGEGGGGPGVPAQAQPPRPPRFPPPGYGGEGAEGGFIPPEGSFGEPGMGGPQDPSRPNLGPAIALPQGLFFLRDWQQVIGWVHDENVKSEKTYRYRVRYKVLNPVYRLPRNTTDPKLADVFDVTSDWSDWTEITVQPRSSFFIASTFGPNTPAIKVEIFKWDAGVLTPRTVTVSPGDPIGRLEGGSDFSTGWYLADIRQDTSTNTAYALFINSTGQTLRRTAAADAADPNYTRLKTLAADAAAGATAPR
jgi:hypothetical protein